MTYEIYTDGSYRASQDKGGVGIVWLKDGKKVFEFAKSYYNTTNNIMELMAIKLALLSIKSPMDSLTIYTDSEYAIGCITNEKWNPKKNVELINSIKNLLYEKEKLTSIQFKHVKGHSNNKWNCYVDKLASL